MKAHCQCGALSAEVADDARPVTIMCHCTECQRRSGSPFGTVAYYPAGKVTIEGEATEYTRPTDSGSTFTTGFCPKCGSTVYAKPERMPELTGVTVGALAGELVAPPMLSVYEQSRRHWVQVPKTARRHPRGRDS